MIAISLVPNDTRRRTSPVRSRRTAHCARRIPLCTVGLQRQPARHLDRRLLPGPLLAAGAALPWDALPRPGGGGRQDGAQGRPARDLLAGRRPRRPGRLALSGRHAAAGDAALRTHRPLPRASWLGQPARRGDRRRAHREGRRLRGRGTLRRPHVCAAPPAAAAGPGPAAHPARARRCGSTAPPSCSRSWRFSPSPASRPASRWRRRAAPAGC